MIEKHIQTILVSLITGAIVFASSYVFNDKSDKAVLASQLQTISAQVAELRSEVRASSVSFATKDSHIDHENRIRTLERKVLK